MEFKGSNARFEVKYHFGDDMKRFISDEAARFTTEGNEAASASMDESVERYLRLSRQKNIGRIKELNSEEKSIKKEKSKETKKAATKTALASVFKAKRENANELVSDKITGDALKDGNSGMIKVLTEAINPMRYVRSLGAKIIAAVLPYLMVFMMVFSIMLVIISFLFSILQPIAAVETALNNFIGIFKDDSKAGNETISKDEIDKIVSSLKVDKKHEDVIRYVLSKVGYPYSQEKRTSGDAFDCSSLAYYAWKSADVDLSYGADYPPTAAEEARMLEENHKKLDTFSLEPGDLIFYGGEGNGRYMGIYHVAIYVGNGRVVEALNEKYGVIYQKLRTENTIMVCRPN